MTSSKSKCTAGDGLVFGCDSAPCNQQKRGVFRRDARSRAFVT